MNTSLQIPSGEGGEGFIELKMSDIYRAMDRIEEISIVNDHKAPELISCFVRAYTSLTDHLSQVSAEVVKAKNALSTRTAIVILDEAPRILREKGVASSRSPGGSEDQRNAVLEIDAGFQKARDRLQQLQAFYELLEGKRDSIEKAYMAVRKIIGENFQFKNNRLGSSMPDTNYQRSFIPVPARPDPQPSVRELDAEVEQSLGKVMKKMEDDIRSEFGAPRD